MMGSKATAAEARHMARVKSAGCIVCRAMGRYDWTVEYGPITAYHHVVEGWVRLGHYCGFGLCDPHHSPYIIGGLHHNLAAWEAEHGPQYNWVESQYRVLGLTPPEPVAQWIRLHRAMDAPA